MPFKPGDGPPIILPATRDKPLNARQELFAQGLSRGMSKRGAFKAAGYGEASTGPARLLSMPNVKARVEELMAETAASNRVSIDAISERLLNIIERNADGETVSSQNLARQALMDLARMHGLLGAGGKPSDLPPMEPITKVRWVIVHPDGREEDIPGH